MHAPGARAFMANMVDAKRAKAGRKGAKVAHRWKPGDRRKASAASRRVAKATPKKTRSRAAKKAARTRRTR